MKSKKILLALVLIIIVLSIILIEKPFSSKDSIQKIDSKTLKDVGLKVGDVAPDFSLVDTSDNVIKLSEFRVQKAVIINFWASWCTACVSEMPMLQEVSQNYKDSIVVLGVNRQESKRDAVKFAYSIGVSFPLLLDKDRKVNDLYHVINLPVTYFVNKDGFITGLKYGELSREELYKYIDDLV